MPLPTVPGPWNFYRLGPTKEKELFKRRRETYDGVVVPAHIASYYAAFCAEFIGGLQKPYFIDPMTYLFARDPRLIKRFLKDRDTGRTLREGGRKKKGNIKRSYLKLVEEHYAGAIKAAVDEERPLRPADLSNVAKADELVERVVTFQRDKLAALPDKYKKYEKYAAKAGRRIAAAGNPPMLLVPPYFFVESVAPQSWHSVNLDLARRTKNIAGSLPVFGVIFCSLEILSRHGEQIIADYAKLDLDGYLLWVDDFAGYEASASLRVVRDFVLRLGQAGKPIVSMYGDPFSLVLAYSGLTGFCSGICYATSKKADQDIDVEGQIPPRYYIERLKKKMQIATEARRIPLTSYPDFVCPCEICRRKPDPATLDDTESREHFMLVRRGEIDAIRRGTTAHAFARALRETFDRYRDEPLLEPIAHLLTWSTLLSETAKK